MLNGWCNVQLSGSYRHAQRTNYFYLNKIRRCNEQVTEFKGNLTMDWTIKKVNETRNVCDEKTVGRLCILLRSRTATIVFRSLQSNWSKKIKDATFESTPSQMCVRYARGKKRKRKTRWNFNIVLVIHLEKILLTCIFCDE